MTYTQIKNSNMTAQELRAKAQAMEAAGVPPGAAWAEVSAHWFSIDRLRMCAERLEQGHKL